MFGVARKVYSIKNLRLMWIKVLLLLPATQHRKALSQSRDAEGVEVTKILLGVGLWE